MSNPYFDLQEETKTRLALHATLAHIPMVTEEKGDIEKRIQTSLVKGGIQAGDTAKAGLAFLIFTPSGRGQGNTRTALKQGVIVRVALFCKPLINDGASGHQIAPLEAHWAAQQQMLSWNRGPGQPPLTLELWDSEEANNEISYYNDFSVPLMLNTQ